MMSLIKREMESAFTPEVNFRLTEQCELSSSSIPFYDTYLNDYRHYEGLMRLTKLSVKNFKGLRDISIPLSRFVCLIGRNNAGKSSLLQSLLLFVEGRKLDPSLYFDPTESITVAVRIEEVGDSELAAITNEEHRNRFKAILKGGAVTLVRRYTPDGSSRLRWLARIPKEERLQSEFVDKLLEGQKAGASFAELLSQHYPELTAEFTTKTIQKQARTMIEGLADIVPDEERIDRETDLPTGIDNAVRQFLPEPIYIPAVKDLADEIATKDSASFGKLLGILLNQLAPDLETTQKALEDLRGLLNKTALEGGGLHDGRLPAVRNIEAALQNYVQENFPRVTIDMRIPPPEIKTVLSSAEIWVDDGVPGHIESKGDGLKRTVTFSILRTYTDLKRLDKAKVPAPGPPRNYLFLFEEPELYLHPTGQRILFDALTEISGTNHVVVSTHSPIFFDADATGTFIKLVKKSDPNVAIKPFTKALCVDLGSVDNKSRFQLISFETNNTAFFFETVVLVEGDSELLVLPHLARILNPDASAIDSGVAFCRIGGKGNISRYREFFEAFDVRVCVIADLDCVIRRV